MTSSVAAALPAPTPTLISGNVTSCPAGTTSLLVVNNPSSASKGAITATISGSSKQFLAVTATAALNGVNLEVFVKGGPDTYEYVLPVTTGGVTYTGLHSPPVGSNNMPTVSHYLICQSGTPTPGSALPPQVFVGYADSDHAGSLPSPWQGATTNAAGGPLQFVGCNFHSPDACVQGNLIDGGDVYDSGALLINNVSTDGSSITITGGSVSIGTCLFQPWTGVSATVPAGGSLILTQTGGPAPTDCAAAIGVEAPDFNLDTSEFPNESGLPPYGNVLTGDMTQCFIDNGLIPKIQLTYTSSNAPSTVLTANFSDTGQILNTGGFDLGVCTNSGDEFHAWSGPLGP